MQICTVYAFISVIELSRIPAYYPKYDKAKGVSLKTFWAEINNAFRSYKIKNRTMRKKEHENFGTDDDKNFSFIVSKIKKDKHL